MRYLQYIDLVPNGHMKSYGYKVRLVWILFGFKYWRSDYMWPQELVDKYKLTTDEINDMQVIND